MLFGVKAHLYLCDMWLLGQGDVRYLTKAYEPGVQIT